MPHHQNLETQIAERSKEISTDAYAMSVGELFSLYQNGELDIHPEFQRFYRWSPTQKSKFIESVLLGIPLPSIFVAQRDDGTWDLVDGLQRISTLLQLFGELLDEDGNKEPALTLAKTDYLPALEGMSWDGERPLPNSAKLKIRRSRIDLKIVLNTSDPAAKYELFQRLNTGGSIATDQEVRNCLLIMINKSLYDFISELAKFLPFRETLPLTERQIDESYDLELVCRFIVLRKLSREHAKEIVDVGDFLTNSVREIAQQSAIDYTTERRAFQNTFRMISEALGEHAFKKFDNKRGAPTGPFLISVFETIALGIGFWADDENYHLEAETIRNIHSNLWNDPNFQSKTGSGVRASQRIPFTLPHGREIFKT